MRLGICRGLSDRVGLEVQQCQVSRSVDVCRPIHGGKVAWPAIGYLFKQ
jgi:hypothetical protein